MKFIETFDGVFINTDKIIAIYKSSDDEKVKINIDVGVTLIFDDSKEIDEELLNCIMEEIAASGNGVYQYDILMGEAKNALR